MNYTLVLSSEAQARIPALPTEVRAVLPVHFARLSEHPATLSFPGAPPASLPNRQLFAFPVDLPDGRRFTVRVHF